jgi:hypothetical protein
VARPGDGVSVLAQRIADAFETEPLQRHRMADRRFGHHAPRQSYDYAIELFNQALEREPGFLECEIVFGETSNRLRISRLALPDSQFCDAVSFA